MTENVRSRVGITPLGGLLPVLMLCLLFASSTSGDVKDGVAAYERGDYKTALNHLQSLAEQGDAEAQHYLGWMYEYGAALFRTMLRQSSAIQKPLNKDLLKPSGWRANGSL